MKGLLFVVAAPSGAGKTSLVAALLSALPGELALSISHTTRPIRTGEEDGVNYHFTPRETFDAMIKDNQFLEYADVFGNLYGTASESLNRQRESGNDVVLEIDWQGANQVRAAFPDTISIFVLPPSRKELLARLTGRGQDSDEVIEHRTAQAHTELSQYNDFDYLVINDDFSTATKDMMAIVRAARSRREVVKHRHQALIDDLLR